MSGHVAVVVPVHRNAATLPLLVARLGRELEVPWVLRLVVDACPEDSAAVATALAGADPRVHVTVLQENVGQHRAIVTGLRAESDARTWVCMDADLQDPPDAVPALLDRLTAQGGGVVFAGRQGRYETAVRRTTGVAHRLVIRSLTGLPIGAGAFFAMDGPARSAVISGVLDNGAPSVVVAAGTSGGPTTSIPVRRDLRAHGTSSWSARARVRQSALTIRWALRQRLQRARSRTA